MIFAIVGFPSDVREVMLGEDGALGPGLKPGNVLVDMTTSEPSLAIEIHEAARARTCTASTLRSPVATSAPRTERSRS
ncbi:MAG: hypothetical protein Ct9H300mP1_27270 [Planctomycetaceae bacterium]|nr:MAG: hypothetical protein Ct9H300mP1_27270 [Planctomycetaceae bacterium]